MDLVHELLAQGLYKGWLFNYQVYNDLLKLFILTLPPDWKTTFCGKELVQRLVVQLLGL